MSTLSKRLARLEGDAGIGAASVLILSIPSAGGEFNLVKDAAGNKVTRQPDESEDRFLERARAELISTRNGNANDATTLWVLRDGDEELLAAKHAKHAEQLGAGHLPLRPSVNRTDWLRLHGLDPAQLEK